MCQKVVFGSTVTEIWQQCGLYNFFIGSTEFQLPKNMFLGQLEGKMWQKVLFWQHCCKNLAILLIEQFSDWVNWILCPEKHGYRAQNHVSRPIGRKMWQKDVFWQHCYGNLAALLSAHFSNWFQWIPRPKKRGYRAQNYVSRPIRSKVMMKIVINQSKFPLKSHLCDVIQKSRFPAT